MTGPDIDLSRREFTVAALTGFVGTAQAQPQERYDFEGAALLAGPASARPAAGDPFFDNKIAYQYLYHETDLGRRWSIDEDSSNWSRINQSRYEDANGDEYVVSASGDQLTIEHTGTSQVVTSIGPRGPQLATSSVITSDTTVRDRFQAVQADTTAGGVAITIGTELERNGQPLIVKDVGGSASGLAPIDISAESGSQIDGSATQSITNEYGSVALYYETDLAQWFTDASGL